MTRRALVEERNNVTNDPYGLTQPQLDDVYLILRTLSQKADALATRIANRDMDRFGGRVEDLLHDATYLSSFIPFGVRQNEMTELDRSDQVAT